MPWHMAHVDSFSETTPTSRELEYALDDGDVFQAPDDQERGEEEDDEDNDCETPVGVVVNARRAHLVAGTNRLRAPKKLSEAAADHRTRMPESRFSAGCAAAAAAAAVEHGASAICVVECPEAA
jgi:hypothetical protein